MNTQNTTTTFLTENRNRILFFFLLFLLSSVGMFGQEATTVSAEIIKDKEIVFTSNEAHASSTTVDFQIDFVGWFMGSKQPQNNEATATIKADAKKVTKKCFLSLGISPNKVLYRTFMKKVASQNNALV